MDNTTEKYDSQDHMIPLAIYFVNVVAAAIGFSVLSTCRVCLCIPQSVYPTEFSRRPLADAAPGVSTFEDADDVVRAIVHAYIIVDRCTSTLEHKCDPGTSEDGVAMMRRRHKRRTCKENS